MPIDFCLNKLGEFMKKWLALLVICSSIFANDVPPPPNPPAPTCMGVTGLYVTGDFIYWKARQDEMINVAELDISQVNADRFLNIKVIDLKYSFDPGFKLGLGWKLPYDGWDLFVKWTHLHNQSKHTFTSAAHNLINVERLGEQNPPFVSNRARLEYDLMFNSIDFDWGRRFAVSDTWVIRPSFGMKTVWLYQDLKFRFENPQTIPLPTLGSVPGPTQFNSARNDYWGIGPYAAFEGKWTFGWGIGLFGQVSGAILWGSFDQASHSTENELDAGDVIVSTVDQKGKAHRVRPTLQMMIGLDWERCLIPNRLSGQIRIGYETQYYFSQLLTIRDVEECNVSLEGLTLSARLDF